MAARGGNNATPPNAKTHAARRAALGENIPLTVGPELPAVKAESHSKN